MHKAVKHLGLPLLLAASVFAGVHYLTGMHTTDLAVHIHNGKHIHFATEVALSSDEGKKGLQGRSSLDDDRAMLFPIPNGQIVWMWMKDTSFPIDMIFISSDHHISKIVPHNQPFDETAVQSDGPVAAILEVADGVAQKDEINVGDLVDWK